MPSYRITGLKAAIDGLHCLKKFQVMLRNSETVAACSASDGAVLRGKGNKDWGGVAVGYGLPAKYPGDVFTYTGSDRNGQGWQSEADGAIVSKVAIVCPTTSGRFIQHQLWFEATGSLAKGSYAATDAAIPNPLPSAGLAFHAGGTQRYGVDGWQFTIEGNLTPPKYPSHMEGWPVRDAGNIDAVISWAQTFDAMNQILEVNDFYVFQLYTSATQFYEVQWGQYAQIQADYDIEGEGGRAKYIEHNSAAKFSGYNNGVKGKILKPGGAAYWP